MGLTPVAKHGGKGRCGNQEGVGDDEYHHKVENDDAEQFGLLRFVFVLVEGLWEGKGREVCVEGSLAWLSLESLALSENESRRRNMDTLLCQGVDIGLVPSLYSHCTP